MRTGLLPSSSAPARRLKEYLDRMALSHLKKQQLRWSAGLPHVAVIALGICGCASRGPTWNSANATVATAVEQNCEQPGVRIDGIKHVAPYREIQLTDRFSPVNLPPGRYEIAVACQNPYDEQRHQCVFWGHPTDYPTYHLPLKAGVRYTFRCFVKGNDLFYRIAETNSHQR